MAKRTRKHKTGAYGSVNDAHCALISYEINDDAVVNKSQEKFSPVVIRKKSSTNFELFAKRRRFQI